MQTTIQQPTDDELRRADQEIRRFWLRVYTLVHDCAAPLDLAIQAVQSANQETHVCTGSATTIRASR